MQTTLKPKTMTFKGFTARYYEDEWEVRGYITNSKEYIPLMAGNIKDFKAHFKSAVRHYCTKPTSSSKVPGMYSKLITTGIGFSIIGAALGFYLHSFPLFIVSLISTCSLIVWYTWRERL